MGEGDYVCWWCGEVIQGYPYFLSADEVFCCEEHLVMYLDECNLIFSQDQDERRVCV